MTEVVRRAYITGPINSPIQGLTPGELKLRFNLCERWINEHLPEWEVVNPLKVGADSCKTPDCGPFDGHSHECWLKHDLREMLTCNAFVMLPHAEDSRGAQLEMLVARTLSFESFVADEDGRIIE